MRRSIDLTPPRHGRLVVVRGTEDYTRQILHETLDAAVHSRFTKQHPVLFVSHPDVACKDYGEEHKPLVTDSPEEIYHNMEERTGIVIIDGAAHFPCLDPTDQTNLRSLVDAIVKSNRLVIAADHGTLDGRNPFGSMAELLALSNEVHIENGSHLEPWLTAYVGSMYSMKTRTWKLELQRLQADPTVSPDDVLAFKYLRDVRYGGTGGELFSEGEITLHNRESIKAIHILSIDDSLQYMEERGLNPSHVFYDEGQFLKNLRRLAELKERGIRGHINGLLRGFNRGKFGDMADVLAIADMIHYNSAVCTTCGSPAQDSQRLKYTDDTQTHVNPAHIDDPLEAIGGAKGAVKDPYFYEARCLDHWILGGEQVPYFAFTRYKT